MSTATPNVSTLVLQNRGVGNVATQAVVNVAKIPAAQMNKPKSGIVLANNVVFKTITSAVSKPVTNAPKQIQIRNEEIQSSVEIRTGDKKIIISGTKSVKDIPPHLLQQILSSVKNIKSKETVLVLNTQKEATVPIVNTQNEATVPIVNAQNEATVSSKEIKSYESIVKDVLQNDDSDIVPENDKAPEKIAAPSDSLKSDSVVDQKDVEKKSETNKTCLENNDHVDKIIVNQSGRENVRNKITTDSENTCNKNNIITSSLDRSSNNVPLTSIPNKVTNVEENNRKIDQDHYNADKRPKIQSLMKPILAVAPRQSPKHTVKQKKFLYRLKSKNGKVLSYISDTHIILKKPIIRLDKMTQADAERLSKQFAEEKKNRLKRTSRLFKSSADSNVKVDSSKKDDTKEKHDQSDSKDSASQSVYGVQTRKRKLKFLPDGRVLRDKKLKTYESSSSLSSLDDDELDKPVVTSDEDYHEDVDLPMSSDDDKDIKDVFSVESTNTKKITPPKKVSPGKSNLLNSKADIKNTSKTYCKKTNDPKISISPAITQPKTSFSPAVAQPTTSFSPAVVQPTTSFSPAVVQPKTSISTVVQPKTAVNALPVQHRLTVDAPTIFATLLKVPIHPHQLNTRRFKPKVQTTPGKKNTSFMFKKVFSPDLKQLIPLLNTNPNIISSTIPEKSTPQNIYKPATLPQTTAWSHSNLSQKIDYNMSSFEPPPLAPLSNRGSPASRNNNKNIFKTLAPRNRLPYQPALDVTAKFEGFTNTKVVKTKEGPKKAIIEELKKLDEPRTIYDIMEEIFDSMPHWNIHVIPENKSFCLGQISLGRTGIPVLKKSIEINSEFMAKVYVHQLHCRRYDGIYDTESKIRKLIQDVDAVVV